MLHLSAPPVSPHSQPNVAPNRKIIILYRVFIKYCVFFKNLKIWQSLNHQHWPAIGCSKNGQPIRVTLHLDLLHRRVALFMQGIGWSELGKNTIFNEHPVGLVGGQLVVTLWKSIGNISNKSKMNLIPYGCGDEENQLSMNMFFCWILVSLQVFLDA